LELIENRIVGSGVEQLDNILFNPRNWRVHPAGQQSALEGVLDEVGYVQNVIINKRTGHLVDGHLRCQLAARKGEKEIPVVYVDISEEEEALVLATIDPIGAMANTDKQKLQSLMEEIKSESGQVNDLLKGIADKEHVQFGELQEAPEPQIDKAEELRVKWGVETGQLWQLGEHRLICGDCTDKAVVDRVMQGELAGAVVTDPPYGINREGIENDDPEGLAELFDGCLEVMPIENAVIIAFQSPRLFPVWLDAVREHEHKFERMLWMYKSNDETRPWRGWIMTSEAILVSSIGKGEWIEVKPYNHDCYKIEWGKDEIPTGIHASVKPMAVIEDLTKRIGGIVYDPFLGSGTTLIACERLGRKCRAIEISPAYCAVTIQRWVDMTGGEPRLLE
jgi:DNA modification methylase